MDANAQHAVMARQAAGMVAVMVCFVVNRLRRIRGEETIPYGPRTHAERHRQSTLQMMYNYNDLECIAMLRMKRVPFFSLCNLLRSRGLVPETVGCPVEEQVAMFMPAEEGFVGALPEDDDDVPLEEPAMVNVRDQICNAMWASRGSSTT